MKWTSVHFSELVSTCYLTIFNHLSAPTYMTVLTVVIASTLWERQGIPRLHYAISILRKFRDCMEHVECTCKKMPRPPAPGPTPTCSSSAAPGSVCLRPGWLCSHTAAGQCRGPAPPPPRPAEGCAEGSAPCCAGRWRAQSTSSPPPPPARSPEVM